MVHDQYHVPMKWLQLGLRLILGPFLLSGLSLKLVGHEEHDV
jgi:hypothetical protein